MNVSEILLVFSLMFSRAKAEVDEQVKQYLDMKLRQERDRQTASRQKKAAAKGNVGMDTSGNESNICSDSSLTKLSRSQLRAKAEIDEQAKKYLDMELRQERERQTDTRKKKAAAKGNVDMDTSGNESQICSDK